MMHVSCDAGVLQVIQAAHYNLFDLGMIDEEAKNYHTFVEIRGLEKFSSLQNLGSCATCLHVQLSFYQHH
jgi:hypothetical protein